jgi:hypothetical protein
MQKEDVTASELADLDGIDLFDLTVAEVGDGAAAFAVPSEGSGGCMSCGCHGTVC